MDPNNQISQSPQPPTPPPAQGNNFLPKLAVIILVFSLVFFLAYVVKDIYESRRQGGGLQGLMNITNFFYNQFGGGDKLKKAIEEQQYVDEEFADFEKRVAGKYPWRSRLPLTNSKYFVLYDIIAKQFTARLYPDNNDNIYDLQAEVIRRLKKEKKIPLEQYKIDYDMWPRNGLEPY